MKHNLLSTIPSGKRSIKLTPTSKLYQAYAAAIQRYCPALPSDYPYNISLCHERRFLWYRVAKVCTRTVFAAFDKAGLTLDADHSMRCYYSPKHFRDYFKFAFVRCPWDRLASCWRHKVLEANYFGFTPGQRQSMSEFESFVDWVSTRELEACDFHLRLQCRLIDLNHVDFVGRFENFENDFRAVAARIDLPVGKIPHENASASSSRHIDVYNARTRKLVADLYARDFAIFGYDPERVER